MRQCEGCQEIFCTVCTILDYSFRFEKPFCHACNDANLKGSISSQQQMHGIHVGPYKWDCESSMLTNAEYQYGTY